MEEVPPIMVPGVTVMIEQKQSSGSGAGEDFLSLEPGACKAWVTEQDSGQPGPRSLGLPR